MDPQQRIFLETAWHALEDAGLTRAELRGSETGVFVGVHGHSRDYGAMQFADPSTLDGYAATGTALDVIPGRLAYWLDLHGPAMVVDTACSSSLVALHLACRSLRAGDCRCAIVGGVNLLCGGLEADERCAGTGGPHSGDASRDGGEPGRAHERADGAEWTGATAASAAGAR